MRTWIACAMAAHAALAACSVPDKVAITGDAPTPDAAPDGPPAGDAPDTSIVTAPAAFTRVPAATFAFTSNDPAATFACSLDSAAPAACVSPATFAAGDGLHTFSVRAIDRAGRGDDTPAEHVWTVDTIPPTTTITKAPPAADNSELVVFSFSSNEANVAFDCSLDNGQNYAPCTSDTQFGPLADGTHVFAVRARDRAGNVDSTPAIHAWTIDTTTPDTQIVTGPSGAVANTAATFVFTSADAGAGATFECELDSGGFAACTSPKAYTGLAEATHVFAVRVRDGVGNVDPTPATRTWTVDLTPPDTEITRGPSGTVNVASASFEFTTGEATATYVCSLDGAPAAACTSPFTAMQLAQGPHTFSVRGSDAAGNTDASPATRSWTVDTIEPELALTAGPAEGSTSGPRVMFAFTVDDGVVGCSLDGSAFAPCVSPQAANLPAGPHELRIRATDAAGNVALVTRAWTVACAAPDATGAVGLLHLDDEGQALANAVPSGAPGVLGLDDSVETVDPASVPGRFATALGFAAAEDDVASWVAGLGGLEAFALELWARPVSAGPLLSGDGFALTAMAVNATSVRFVATVMTAGGPRSVQSAPVATTAWHHVIASLAAPDLRLWVDGVATAVGQAAPTTAPGFDAIQLGGGYGGAIDEVWLSGSAVVTDDAALARYCPL